MKLFRKLAKLGRCETYRRGWRRAQRSIFRLPFGPVLAGINQNRLLEIQKRYPGLKYADIDHWLRVNRERVQDLKLHRSSPQRVLDLGCGGGFFLFILKRFGHSVLGLDIDESPLFRELLEVFGVPRIDFRIEPFDRCRIFSSNSTGSPLFLLGSIDAAARTPAGGRANGNFYCAISSDGWRPAARFT